MAAVLAPLGASGLVSGVLVAGFVALAFLGMVILAKVVKKRTGRV